MHSTLFEAFSDKGLACALDDTRRHAQSVLPELSIAHAAAIVPEVCHSVGGFFAGRVLFECGNHVIDPAGQIELIASLLAPRPCRVGARAVDGLGGVEEMLPSMEAMPNSVKD